MYSHPMQHLQIGDNRHKLQEHAPRSVNVSGRLCADVGWLNIPWLTLRRFLGLLVATEADGDACCFAPSPLLVPFCSMASDLTIRGVPSDCNLHWSPLNLGGMVAMLSSTALALCELCQYKLLSGCDK